MCVCVCLIFPCQQSNINPIALFHCSPLPTIPFLFLLKFYRTIKSTSLGTIDIVDEIIGCERNELFWSLFPFGLLPTGVQSVNYEIRLLGQKILVRCQFGKQSNWWGSQFMRRDRRVGYLNLEREAVTRLRPRHSCAQKKSVPGLLLNSDLVGLWACFLNKRQILERHSLEAQTQVAKHSFYFLLRFYITVISIAKYFFACFFSSSHFSLSSIIVKA